MEKKLEPGFYVTTTLPDGKHYFEAIFFSKLGNTISWEKNQPERFAKKLSNLDQAKRLAKLLVKSSGGTLPDVRVENGNGETIFTILAPDQTDPKNN